MDKALEKQLVLSNIYLGGILPLMEDVVRLDSEAKGIAEKWNSTIMFHVSGGSATTLTFKGGKCTAQNKAVSWPSQGLWFSSPEKLNKMFAGEKVVPLPWPIPRMGLINGFTKLADRLNYYMKPTPEVVKDPKKLAIVVELMLYAALGGAAQVGMSDSSVAKYVAGIPEGYVQISIVNGPSAHICRNKDNTFTFGKGNAPQPPSANMIIKDVDTAYKLFTNQLDSMVSLCLSDITIKGLTTHVDSINILLEKVAKYTA